jgi:hypothetical protein
MTLEMFMDKPVQVTMRKCNKCNIPKPETPEYFSRDKKARGGLRRPCKECVKDLYYNGGGREARKAHNQNGGIARAWKRRHEKTQHRTALNNLRYRVKKVGKYKFLLGEAGTPETEAYIEYLKTITHCPDCAKGVVWFSYGKMNPDSASFDRIDSYGDYTKENVRGVCNCCNRRKQDSPVDEWVGLLEVRVKKGILKEVDPTLIKYLIENKKEE